MFKVTVNVEVSCDGIWHAAAVAGSLDRVTSTIAVAVYAPEHVPACPQAKDDSVRIPELPNGRSTTKHRRDV